MGLALTGGAMVIGSALVGFTAGVAVMQWGLEQDEKETAKAGPAKDRPGSPGLVSYARMSSKSGSLDCPADGTNLTTERKDQINDSTPSNPVEITLEEAHAMTLEYVLIHIRTGRFKLEGQIL